MWLLKACLRFNLPEPVSLNRFFALDFVFIFGIIALFVYYSLFLFFWRDKHGHALSF